MPNPFDSSYDSEQDRRDAGFRALGREVRIARNCTTEYSNSTGARDAGV